LWNLLHHWHVLDWLGLSRFDPWISYVLLVAMALVALHLIEKPAQRQLRKLMQA
jgi:peptidoglycan/LPS O-acetylase OafA/YrhL